MVTFQIHHGVKLKSTGKQLLPFTTFATENEGEVTELRELAGKFKLCTEFVPKEPEKKAKKEPEKKVEVNQNDDITLVKGLGKALLDKLAQAKITKKSEFKTAVNDSARTDEMKALLGGQYEKILAQLKDPA